MFVDIGKGKITEVVRSQKKCERKLFQFQRKCLLAGLADRRRTLVALGGVLVEQIGAREALGAARARVATLGVDFHVPVQVELEDKRFRAKRTPVRPAATVDHAGSGAPSGK